MSKQRNDENRLYSPFRKLVTGNLSLQIILTILAAILYAVLTNFMSETAAALITSAVFIPAYFAMIYTFAWGVAERERNMVLYGHMEEDRMRGLRSGLVAVIPLFVYSLIVIFLAYTGRGANAVGIYRICTAPFVLLVNPLIEHAPFVLPLLAVFSPLAAWWGYKNGYVLYRLWDHLIYQNGVKPRKGERRKDAARPRRRT